MQTLTVRELRNLPQIPQLPKEQGAIPVTTNNGNAEFVITAPPFAFKLADFAAHLI